MKLKMLLSAACLTVGASFAAEKFEFLYSWGRVKDEASARAYAEIGVTDIAASGREGFAAARKYGLVPYCSFAPVGPHKQVLRSEEQRYFDFINATDLEGRLSKGELYKAREERLKAARCRFGGEPDAALDLCPQLISCFLSDTNCVMAKARLDMTLAANPDAGGISFDYIGFTNFRSCECDDCKARLDAFLKREGLEESEAARNRFFRESLVSYINTLVDYVHGVRPGIKVTIHLYPVFMPDPLYGRDIKADTVQETVAWYFQWPDGKVADYTRRVCAAGRPAGSVGVPFVGLNANPGRALAWKSPERLEAELCMILAAGGRRLGVCNGDDMIKPGYREVFMKYCPRNAAPDESNMFPFLVRPDADGTAMDMRALLPAPAGRNGFIRRAGEHFVDCDGNVVRMNGVNFTAAANFPEHADAERTADELARLGFNCVRMHLVDMAFYASNFIDPQYCLYPAGADGRLRLDESKRDRMEYLIAALKKRGIYVDMNLHAGRELGPADGYRKTCWANRGVSFFDKAFFDAECDYAREILTHVNPYTGLRMADDPAMAMVEINNENSLMQVYWSNTLPNQGADPWFLEEFDRQRAAAGFGSTTNEINRFIVQTEQRYFRAMRDFLRDELGVKCVVYGSQLDYTAPWAYGEMDAIDAHIYWNHPGWIDDAVKKRPNGAKRSNPEAQWTVRNVPLVDADIVGDYCNPVMFRGSRRVKGQPFITTECATPYPCWYAADFQPIIHAYASFQDWAGVFTYSWNNETNSFPNHVRSFFSMMCCSDVLAHMPASAALFLRGDAAKAKERVEVAADRERIYEQAAKSGRHTPLVLCDAGSLTDGKVPNSTFFRHAVAVDHGAASTAMPAPEALDESPAAPFVSDTRELTFLWTPNSNGVFLADTPNVKVVSGHVDGRSFDLGGVRFEIGKTKLGWCAVSLLSQKGNGFGEGSRLLLAATGYTHNGGAKFRRLDAVRWTGLVSEFGEGKPLTEGVPLVLTLPAGAAKCWALDEAGRRMREVPVVAAGNGGAAISVDSSFRTVWYEIAR